MASFLDETTLELSTEERLDDEITKLKSQGMHACPIRLSSQTESQLTAAVAKVESLKWDLQLHTTTLLAAEPVRDLLRREDPDLSARADEQAAHRQQCLYRACATATTFRVRDPDPHAVDGGAVLGVRVEVMSRARFIRPYFVLLNRPYAAAAADGGARQPRALRVHRHTVPPCVPLAALAARYLPPPGPLQSSRRRDEDGQEDGDARALTSNKQDLPRFVRALRRELVRYHNRVAVIGDLRKAAGLEGKRRKSREAAEERDPASAIVDVSAADAGAKQIRVEWGDGKSGRLVMSDDGEVLKMVVQGASGQDREAVRQFLGGAVRIEQVSKRL